MQSVARQAGLGQLARAAATAVLNNLVAPAVHSTKSLLNKQLGCLRVYSTKGLWNKKLGCL